MNAQSPIGTGIVLGLLDPNSKSENVCFLKLTNCLHMFSGLPDMFFQISWKKTDVYWQWHVLKKFEFFFN